MRQFKDPLTDRIVAALGGAEMTSGQIADALGNVRRAVVSASLAWLEACWRVERCGMDGRSPIWRTGAGR